MANDLFLRVSNVGFVINVLPGAIRIEKNAMENNEWIKIVKEQKRLRRPCLKCGVMFHPEGRYQKLCPDCYLESHHTRKRIKLKNYFGAQLSRLYNVNECKVCNKQFLTKKEGRSYQQIAKRNGYIVRPKTALTCSKKCSMIWYHDRLKL